MKSIKEAEEDVKAGRVRDYDEFLKGAEEGWGDMGLKSRELEKDFRKLDIQIKRRSDSVLRRLKTDPYLGKLLRGELSGKWSLRMGDLQGYLYNK